MDGSEQLGRTKCGARPGESIAGLLFSFLFSRIAKQVRCVLNDSEFRGSLPCCSIGTLSAKQGLDTSTEATEAFYADDAMHESLRQDAAFVTRATGCTARVFDDVARRHGLLLNFGLATPKR